MPSVLPHINILSMENTIIGILGDGQLAKMSGKAALDLEHKVIFYGNQPDGPCHGLGEFIQGTFNDLEKLSEFAQKVDVITLENEFVTSSLLEKLESMGKTVYPSSKTFKQIENKLAEKRAFEQMQIPVTPYSQIRDFEQDMNKFISAYGFPVVLKSSTGGYDGYGTALAKSMDEALLAFQNLGGEKGHDILVEKAIGFEREVAVTVARNPAGKMAVYPVCDTIQENNKCNIVCCPSNMEEPLMEEVQNYAKVAMEKLDAVGVFSFEFFITQDGKILINESAPRPHNSAHYTMDACETCQFKNHILTITGKKPGSAQMLVPRAVMLNLLGTQNGAANLQGTETFAKAKDVYFHIYGKKESRVGRKMGHVNLVGRSREQLIKLAKFIESNVRV